MYLISACLIGCEVTWRAGANAHEVFAELVRAHHAIPVCPEQLGGLPTPRPPAEIVGGSGEDVLEGGARVLTADGRDVTENFLRGAREVLRLAELVRPELIILKERSPSCGVRQIYDGTFSGTLRAGCGVTTALLRRHGWPVTSDEEFLGASPRPAGS
ncbi:MAG: DUF523 domain-containing protein [Candidatus Sumerlaeaceae bacterium]|jgi:uncharacterized protein YbbK (DUF523 family)